MAISSPFHPFRIGRPGIEGVRVSAVELADLSDRHRLSAALTAFVDPEQRVRARIHYDYTQDDAIGSEHVAWFQIQLQCGGIAGSHADHGHYVPVDPVGAKRRPLPTK